MKLHSQQIEMLAQTIVSRLVETNNARIGAPDQATLQVGRMITDDLSIEDRLNEEVRGILSEHESKMRMQGVQYHEMFKMVKQKLVRERKLIL